MLLAIAVVFPSFEIATPRMITMMLTTSMISNSVKPCCFLFVLISIKWGPSVFLRQLQYLVLQQLLVGQLAGVIPTPGEGFVAISGSMLRNQMLRLARNTSAKTTDLDGEDNPTCPRYISVGFGSLGLRMRPCLIRW